MAINAGSVYSELILDTKKYQAGLSKADKDMKGFASRLGKAGKTVGKVGKQMTTKVTLPIIGMGAAALKVGADFEGSMSEVQAISGATGSQLKQMSDKARLMGKTTKYSASESAQAMKYMAMAGWDTTQIIGGLDGVMHLAAASGEDLATVSDIVTDSMTAFGMKAEESARFADVLAAASSNSNTNVGIMGETFKYVAPLAGSLGYTIEDTALGIGLMANAGIKGSQAGTAMRSMLTRLIKPTKESGTAMKKLGISMTDSEGKMKPLSQVMKDLRNKFKDLTPEQQAFYGAQIAGQEAMSGFLAVVNASEGDFNKLQGSINNSTGAAKKMADIMDDNLKGRLKKLVSQLQEVGIQLSKILIPMIEKAMKKISEWVEKFSNLDKSTQETIVKLGFLVAAIGPVLSIGSKLGKIVSLGTKGFKLFSGAMTVAKGTAVASTPAMAGLAKGITLLSGPIGWTIGGIAAVTAGGIALNKHMQKDSIPTIELYGNKVSESTQKAVQSYMDLNDKATLKLNELAWSQEIITEESSKKLEETYGKMTDTILTKIDERHEEEMTKAREHFANTAALTTEEEARILERMEEGHEKEQEKAQQNQDRIMEILTRAKEAKRPLKESERDLILQLQEEMTTGAVELLSKSEVESKAILEKMKAQSGDITARQAAEVVQNSKKATDGAREEANKKYDETVAWAIRQRDETNAITDEEADKIIEDAERTKENAIKQAETRHDKIVDEAKKQAEEHVDYVDWETGEVKSRWRTLGTTIGNKLDDMTKDFNDYLDDLNIKIDKKLEPAKKRWDKIYDNLSTRANKNLGSIKTQTGKAVDKIKEFFDFDLKLPDIKPPKLPKLPKLSISGKFSIKPPSVPKIKWNAEGAIFNKPFIFGNQGVGEAGPEAVLPIEKLSDIMASTLNVILSKDNAQKIIPTKRITDEGSNITQNINIYSPEPLNPSEISRKNLQVLRQLALEWGL
ncbi:phage tail tape measure protein [Clostridium sp. D2Q-14]|uniref:phage tail tape measure protein n=1 Tax=Anaeromonas gelatinilytica TaxID=2683194 RepID=UPI00193AE0CE|nr:phage tail tape measure protein [Anaeromonas gelatinilytica]MBS4536804.1 phage tail tape measure protein [Anaeromonas gelatinilytica]